MLLCASIGFCGRFQKHLKVSTSLCYFPIAGLKIKSFPRNFSLTVLNYEAATTL